MRVYRVNPTFLTARFSPCGIRRGRDVGVLAFIDI